MKAYVVMGACPVTLEGTLNDMEAAGVRDLTVTYCGRGELGRIEFTVHGWSDTPIFCAARGCNALAATGRDVCRAHSCASLGCPCRAQEVGGYCPICESDRERERAARDLDREMLPG